MMFGWQRTRGVSTVVIPVIVYDKAHGCTAHCEFVGDLRKLKPEEQRLTLTELAERYPAPEVQPDYLKGDDDDTR